MKKQDRDRADARFNKSQAKAGGTDRDAATKAVLDNMARLKALRLAREAAEPPRPPAAKTTRAKSPKKAGGKNTGAVRLAGEPAERRAPDLSHESVLPGGPSAASWFGAAALGIGVSSPRARACARHANTYAGTGHCTIDRVLVAAS